MLVSIINSSSLRLSSVYPSAYWRKATKALMIEALKKLQNRNLPVVDISKRYADFKDVNDYLCGKKMDIPQTKLKPKRLKF